MADLECIVAGLDLVRRRSPVGEPLAAGYLRDVNTQNYRIAYTVNTKGGSSGSPCFDLDWDLIAIHHEGNGFTNHGIPMRFILRFLETNGKLNLLE